MTAFELDSSRTPARLGGPRPAEASPRWAAPVAGARPRCRETALCVALSAALHLAALAAFAMVAPRGEPSGGSGGVLSVTFVGSDEAREGPSRISATPEEAPPDPADRPEPTAPPDAAAMPEPAPADPATALALLRDDVPPLPVVTPREDQTPATTLAEPTPRPRPPGLRAASGAVADAQSAAPQAKARQTALSAGAGGAPQAGSRGSAQISTGTTRARATAMLTWQAQIQRKLQRSLPTPRGLGRAARDRNITLALSVTPDGRLRGVEVLRSSGDASLDAAALAALRGLGPLPRAPGGLTDPAYAFLLPLELLAP